VTDFIPWDSQPLEEWADKYAQGEFIDLDGHLTHYVEKGEGEPVILIHGFNYDCNIWAENMDALAEGFKVYAIDLWGFGYSTREPLDYGYQLYADQILDFMDGLDIQNASLVGQSMGGGTAILFCTQHRDRVNKLLLVDPAGMPNPMPLVGKVFKLPKVGEFFMRLKTDTVRKKNLADLWIHNKDLITRDYFDNITRFQKVEGSNSAILAVLRKDFFDKLSDEIHNLAQVDVPILIVWGRQDEAIPLSKGEEMHNICKGSCLEIIDNAGHVPNYEQAETFNQMAVEFLGS
jgi:pimeloyl-ACP methyl ester carboxylesterase